MILLNSFIYVGSSCVAGLDLPRNMRLSITRAVWAKRKREICRTTFLISAHFGSISRWSSVIPGKKKEDRHSQDLVSFTVTIVTRS